MFQSTTSQCFAQPAVPGGLTAWMLLLPALNCKARRKKKKKKRERESKKIIQNKRHNRKQEEESDLASSAEARCRVWLDFQLLWLVQARGRLLVAETFSSPSVFIKPLGLVCWCLVGCCYKSGSGRCGELSWQLLTPKVKWNISHTVNFFLITRGKLVKAASQASVALFVLYSTSYHPCCSLRFLSDIAWGYLISMLKEKDGLHRSYFSVFGSVTNDCLWDRPPSSFPGSLLEIYSSSPLSVQQKEQINLQSCCPVLDMMMYWGKN